MKIVHNMGKMQREKLQVEFERVIYAKMDA